MNEELDNLTSESVNPRTAELSRLPTLQALTLINDEDALVAPAVRLVLPEIARAVDGITARLQNGGRLIYIGAGTSGRLGVVDASECPPTFGVSPQLVQALIAGGPSAVFGSQEGAEDRPEGGAKEMDERGIASRDFVIGIAASGTTPFVHGAIHRARELGAHTAIVTCTTPPDSLIADCDISIVTIVGPEVVTGSTRLKAGTATKLVLNTITTGAMILLGETYGNLMVDMRATNAKLSDRAERIMIEVTGVSRERARELLAAAGGLVKTAIVMQMLNVGRAAAESMLAENGGVIRRVVPGAPPPVADD